MHKVKVVVSTTQIIHISILYHQIMIRYGEQSV
jgi:hypothetical protein